MSAKKYKREINFNKNILFFIFFMVLNFMVLFSFVLSSVKEHKVAYSNFQKKNQELILLKNKHQSLQNNLDSRMLKYSSIIKKLSQSYSDVEFPQLLTKYFTDFKIFVKDKVTKANESYIDVSVSAKTNHPENFYLFVNEISSLSNASELIYPISFESQNNLLKIDFLIRVHIMY